MPSAPQDSATRDRRRANHLSALAVGLVLLLAFGWYYISARSAAEHLAKISFRQLNNLADQADAVLENFPYLFDYLPSATVADQADAAVLDPAVDCTASALAGAARGADPLERWLQCRLQDERVAANGAQAAGRALAELERARRERREYEARYRRTLTDTRLLDRLSLRWTAYADSPCAGGSAPRSGARFRLRGPVGNKTLDVVDCPASGAAGQVPVAHLPFGTLFDPAGLGFDFDQFAVLDADGGLLYLSTDRLARGRRAFGRLPDSSEFARLLRLDPGRRPAPRAGEPPPAADAPDPERHTRVRELRFGDTDYTAFVQPHVPGLAAVDEDQAYGTWYIVGFKETRRLDSERFHVAPREFALFTFVLVLAVALLPVVRLVFLGRGTSLTRFDFSLLVVSLLVATGSAVMLGVLTASGGRLARHGEQALETLAADMKRTTLAELERKLAALDEVERRLLAEFESLPPTLLALREQARELAARSALYRTLAARLPALRFAGAAHELRAQDLAAFAYLGDERRLHADLVAALGAAATPAQLADLGEILGLQRALQVYRDDLLAMARHGVDLACVRPGAAYTSADAPPESPAADGALSHEYALAWLLDDNGDQVFDQANNRLTRLRHLSLASRDYFKRARDGQVWRPAWAGPRGLVLERIWSRAQGRKTTVIARPYPVGDDAPPVARRCRPRVAVLMTDMRALTATLLPANFHYAVIADQTGQVLFHSNDEAALIENFYTETDDDKTLLAATTYDQDAHFTSRYSDRHIRGFVTPLNGMPLSLVLYHDSELLDTLQFEAATIAFLPVLAIALLVLGGMELQHRLGYPVSNAWWPHPDNALKHAITALLCGVYALALVANLGATDGWALVGQPVLIGPLLFAYLSLLWAEQTMRRSLMVFIPLVALVWGAWQDSLPLAVLALLIAGLLLWLSGSRRMAEALKPRFRAVHALAGLSLFIAVAGLPVFGFYKDALGYYLARHADFAQAWATDQERDRRSATREYCRGLRADLRADDGGECGLPLAHDLPEPVQACTGAADAPACDHHPTRSFTYLVGRALGDWLAPYSDENALLRPLRGAPALSGAALPRPRLALHLPVSAGIAIVAWLAALLGLVAWLVSRRLFGLQGAARFRFLPGWPTLGGAAGEQPDLTALHSPTLLVGYAAGPRDVQHWRKTHDVVAWHAVPATWPAGRGLVVLGLELALREEDPARAAQCRAALAALLAAGGAPVLVSDVMPGFVSADAVARGMGHLARDPEAPAAWLALLESFTALGAPNRWRGGAGMVDPVDVELATFPELHAVAGEIKRECAAARREVQQRAVVFRHAESLYARKWQASTLREQALMLQLVRRELINPDQHDVLNSLEHRGLVVREPRVRLASRGLQWYLENVEISRELDQFRTSYQDSTWLSMRWPVLMVLGLFGLLLFQSGGDRLQWVLGALGGVVTLGTTLRQLWALARGGESAEK
ncbi:MAG: hypothetical protein AB7I01_07670 [Gammaproteobacteria bacterium]